MANYTPFVNLNLDSGTQVQVIVNLKTQVWQTIQSLPTLTSTIPTRAVSALSIQQLQ